MGRSEGFTVTKHVDNVKSDMTMEIDVNNPVVKLCAEGIQAEMSGRTTDAIRLCTQAWDSRKNDYDSCIAAHYLARYQETAEERLLWNQRALDFATTVDDDSVSGFYPSLYLNLGKSHEDLNNRAEAVRCYQLASSGLDAVEDSSYKETVSNGIASALARVTDLPPRR